MKKQELVNLEKKDELTKYIKILEVRIKLLKLLTELKESGYDKNSKGRTKAQMAKKYILDLKERDRLIREEYIILKPVVNSKKKNPKNPL